MRHIGSIADESQAGRFGDYLLAQGMKNSIEQGASGWAVWVEHDDHVDRAKAELEAYSVNPADSRYNGASRVAEKIRAGDQKKQARLRKRFVDVRTRWGQPQQLGQPVTIALIAICLLVGFITRLDRKTTAAGEYLQIESMTQADQEKWLQDAIERISRNPAAAADMSNFTPRAGLRQIRQGQVWRLITPIFLHFGLLHLIFNMLWLRDFGSQIELNRGTWFFLAFVLFVAIFSNLAEYFWSGFGFGGMSGVVYAMFGYIWIKSRFEPHVGLSVQQQTVVIMFIWLGACMIGLVGAIANGAHVAGLISGILAAYLPIQWRRLRRRMSS